MMRLRYVINLARARQRAPRKKLGLSRAAYGLLWKAAGTPSS